MSKHNIFTLCCIAAELNALSPYVGHRLQTIQFSTIIFNLLFPLLVDDIVQLGKNAHCIDTLVVPWKLCRMCMYYLIIFSFALLPLQIAKV